MIPIMAPGVALGPNNSYYFSSGLQKFRHGLPKDFDTLFTSFPSVDDFLCVALGAEPDSFFASYATGFGSHHHISMTVQLTSTA